MVPAIVVVEVDESQVGMRAISWSGN